MKGVNAMLTNKEIKQLIWEKADNVASKLGLEIFDILIKGSNKNKILEVVIDKADGYVSIGDCERFSKAFDPWLDEIDLFDKSYELVVSSPGLDRKLRGKADYERFKGKLAKFILKGKETKHPVVIGYIDDILEDQIKITEKDSGKLFNIDLNEIDKANLEIEL